LIHAAFSPLRPADATEKRADDEIKIQLDHFPLEKKSLFSPEKFGLD